MNRNKIIFYIVWLTLLALGPITVLRNMPISLITKNSLEMVNFFQRIFGLTIFSLLFFQLILGSHMDFWIQKLGAWVFKFHIREGVSIYLLVCAHILSFMLFNHFGGKGFDPFYVFTGFCILCPNITELYYTFGRIGFWFVSAAVFAGLFRAATPFMQLHWRKFHYLNYVVFFLIWIHSFGAGSDIGTLPFKLFHGPSILIIGGITLHKLYRVFLFRTH